MNWFVGWFGAWFDGWFGPVGPPPVVFDAQPKHVHVIANALSATAAQAPTVRFVSLPIYVHIVEVTHG